MSTGLSEQEILRRDSLKQLRALAITKKTRQPIKPSLLPAVSWAEILWEQLLLQSYKMQLEEFKFI